MAGIRKRAQTWQVRWQQDGQPQTETFALESSAVRFRERVEDAGNAWPVGWVPGKGDVEGAPAVDVATRGITVRSLLDQWMTEESRMQDHVRVTARGALAQRFTVGTLADMPIAAVTQADIQAWVDELARKYAPGTIRGTLTWIGAAFTRAQQSGMIRRSPVYGIRNDGGTKSRNKPVFLTEAEERRLVAAVDADSRLFVRFMLASGLRYGEAWALFGYSVMDTKGVVSVEVAHSRRDGGNGVSHLGDTKTKEVRTVVLPASVGAELMRYAAKRDPSAPLFDLPNSTTAFRYGVWARACKAAGLVGSRQPRIHDMRHTHASRMLANEMPIATLSKRLGHASIQTTINTYGHLEREDKRTQAILNEVYGPSLRAV